MITVNLWECHEVVDYDDDDDEKECDECDDDS